jgi:type III secretion system YscD/HrpQ family protein
VVILLLLLGLLTLGQWGEGLTRRDAAEKLNAHLAREGLAGVRAELAEGTLILKGLAADDRELARIAGLAAAQPYPVKMEVRVLDDRLRAVRETMNSKGFFPEVGLDREGRLEIAVYMKDALVEDRAFYMLDDDLRGLAQAVRRVVHARELRPVLERELRRIGLERVKPDYQDGLVKLPLTPDPEERRRLGEALENVRQELGAPLVFQMADGRTERAATALAPELSPAEDSGLDNLAVMSVTQGPLPFITLSDGQKFFIGAVLPNGATLVGLGDGKLEMALGDTIIIQTLMENQ